MILEERYDVLNAKVVQRKKEFDYFIQILETETSWLTSPASIKYYLIKHSHWDPCQFSYSDKNYVDR